MILLRTRGTKGKRKQGEPEKDVVFLASLDDPSVNSLTNFFDPNACDSFHLFSQHPVLSLVIPEEKKNKT